MAADDTGTVALITAFGSGRIDLERLLESLSRRGAIPDDEFTTGVEALRRLREDQMLDDATVSTVITTMDALRAPPDDATLVRPAASGEDGGAAADDATVVQPRGDRRDDVTRVGPAASPTPARRRTDRIATVGGTSASASDWQSLADAAAGESAGVGMLLKGRFLLERELGRGGMGVVFLARDERKVEALDRDPYVAVKVLNDDFRRHPDSLIALQRESRRSQQLAHDHIVRVYDFDKAGTVVFMTMEYIDGTDLRTLIREQAWNGMPLARARPLIEGMAMALGRAHAAGIVHSDFKPGNVMVTRDGVAKVFDFGIARAGKHAATADGEQTVFDATTLGALTPAYASLEMIQGGEPTARDDIYALGCVCFELLGGKHPFDKASAEVALKENRRPPPLPGLTRRQYRTLCHAVAFRREERLESVEQLVEGLREVSLRERALPLLGYGTAAALLVAGGGWGLSRHLDARQLQAVVAGFSDEGPGRFDDVAQAAAALASLDEEARRGLVIDRNELIERFLIERLDALWNPARGLHEFVKAEEVFALRNELRLFSPTLDRRREQMALEKDEVLNALDTVLAGQIARGEIFTDAAPDALDTLSRVRAIDPSSALLRSPALEQAYDRQVAQALADGDFALAQRRLEVAAGVFPDSLRLQLRRGEVEAAQMAEHDSVQLAAQGAAAGAADVGQAQIALAALIADPAATPAWRGEVLRAATALQGEGSARTAQLRDLLGKAIAHQVSDANDAVRLAGSLSLVEFGLRLAPGSAELSSERTRLQRLQAQLVAQVEQDGATAEAEALTESMRRAASANDLDKAREAFGRLRELRPDDAFVARQAPALLSAAYLRAAQAQAGRGRFAESAALLGEGVALLGERLELRTAHARHAAVAAILQAGEGPLDAAQHAQLGAQLDAATQADAAALSEAEALLRARGLLPEGTLRARLQRLAPASAAGVGDARARARGAPAREAAAGRATAARDGDDEEPLPPVPDGPDPCAGAGLVGRGRFCFDAIDGGRGPTLVVVPGIAGGKAYALSRAEVTISEFNLFCSDTGRCRPRRVADAALGMAPVENVGIDLARAYARWLIRSTGGWRYRLPTDAEWLHAARANADWRQAADSNCIPPTASADQAGGAPVSARGRERNPWGLINLTGNVWEMVADGAARGGAYTSFWSDCTVDARRADSGSAQRDVGIRILRELK